MDDQVEHVPAAEQFHPPGRDLTQHRLVGAIEQLLARLAPGVEGAAHQGATEAAIGQGAAVLPRERHPWATHWSMIEPLISASRWQPASRARKSPPFTVSRNSRSTLSPSLA